MDRVMVPVPFPLDTTEAMLCVGVGAPICPSGLWPEICVSVTTTVPVVHGTLIEIVTGVGPACW